MAFNIDEFRSQGLVFGGARPSLFRVLMQFPAGIAGDVQSASYLIRSASLPSSSISSVPVPYFGRQIKIAGDRQFEDWSVTVMNDEDFDLRNTFESWLNLINTHASNRMGSGIPGRDGGSPNIYKVDLIVDQFGKAGPSDDSGIIRSYKFNGAFPTSVGAIALDWDSTNTIESFDVTFSYDYWEPLATPNGNIYNVELNPA
jgi:hypothetical protein